MTQVTVDSLQSSSAFPDTFSSALNELFASVQPSIVQVHVAGRGGGTGVIWENDGRIITNSHVVADHREVKVLLTDGRLLDAQVLQRNPALDLALLQIADADVPALSIGDSASLRVGEWVFAIGHPWGQRWTLTAGIVSSLRSVTRSDNQPLQYIQSDVRLAPGNSGGPLLDADGRVVGINAMIAGGDLSVSIPSNVVSTWLTKLARRPITLGIEIQTVEISASSQQSQALQHSTGLLIVGLRPERAALHHDLLIGDILLEVASKPTGDATTLRHVLAQGEAEKPVLVKLLRGGVLLETSIATLTTKNNS